MLLGKQGHEDVVIRGARVLDPTEGVDAVLDIRVDGGVVAGMGADLDTNEHRVVEAGDLVLAPGVRRPARPPADARP